MPDDQRTTKYFLDTEFIEDGRTIDLVSIGVVCEDGREFYAEVDNAEVDWDKANDWVRQNVRPHLSGRHDVVFAKRDIALHLIDFTANDGRRPEFWAYYADYDWVALCQMFGTMMDLPQGWPMFCMDLKQLAVSLGDPNLPEQTDNEHHALADARWNHHIHAWLTGGGE